ncbi:glucose-6-phosphate dehydrogenase [Streptomyces sp. NBC_00285]|uniref:glucose-6-phosphate dehydrogenase n=1 Tax=Streptomyces sp. NBC_00285 TaxID=2975700 RepID=UPI002E28FD33|nr:glucose-6-phosphate dehydrogenase [Streptomyces sp. NBC_00285]
MTTPAPRADALVLFGITGDLAKKMLLPALYDLTRQGFLDVPVIGVGRSDWDDERLRRHARDVLRAAEVSLDEGVFDRFAALLCYARVDYDDPASFTDLADQVRPHGFLTHCVALPPSTYPVIAQRLAEAGLADNARLVVEKPFGHDLHSARALQSELTRYFPEERLRRVDHFLAKDVIEDLLTFRFANTSVNAVLDRRFVRSVQITMAEDFDVADRGGFYDVTGCLRDVVQNHLLQMLAYFVMEAPRTGSAVDVLDERIRALRAVRTVRSEDFVRGQYDGYLDVQGVKAGSTTETYCALRTWVNLDRWAGIPFTIRAGKAMAATAIEIVVELNRPVEGFHHTASAQQAPANGLRFRISPRAGVTFDLLAQHEGETGEVDQVAATVDFAHLTGNDSVAYTHVLADAITGDPRRFTTMDMVEELWRIVGPVLDLPGAPHRYDVGGWGPADADRLATDDRWLPLEQA